MNAWEAKGPEEGDGLSSEETLTKVNAWSGIEDALYLTDNPESIWY